MEMVASWRGGERRGGCGVAAAPGSSPTPEGAMIAMIAILATIAMIANLAIVAVVGGLGGRKFFYLRSQL